MSNVGATTGKVPDYIDDADVLSVDEMRGAMADVIKAKKSLAGLASIEGVRTEINALKNQMETIKEQMTALLGLYGTLKNEFEQLQQQRIKELTLRMNGGSTVQDDR